MDSARDDLSDKGLTREPGHKGCTMMKGKKRLYRPRPLDQQTDLATVVEDVDRVVEAVGLGVRLPDVLLHVPGRLVAQECHHGVLDMVRSKQHLGSNNNNDHTSILIQIDMAMYTRSLFVNLCNRDLLINVQCRSPFAHCQQRSLDMFIDICNTSNYGREMFAFAKCLKSWMITDLTGLQ